MELIVLCLLLTPFIGALLASVMPDKSYLLRSLLFLVSLFSLGLSIYALIVLEGGNELKSFFSVSWIEPFKINFSLGYDYVSLYFILANSFVFLGVSVFGFKNTYTHQNERANLSLLLLTQGSLVGVFLATDVVLFYIFWELVMVPVLILLVLNQRSKSVPVYIFIYTLAGSVFMLAGIIVIYYSGLNLGVGFSYPDWLQFGKLKNNFLWIMFALAFAIKTPLFPFHSWQPDTYFKSPNFLTAVLAAIVSKMGWYGFYRFNYSFLELESEIWKNLFVLLALVGTLYPALLAWQSSSIKRVIGYSSMSHLNLALLGIFSGSKLALAGSLFFVLQHAFVIAGIFWLLQLCEDENGEMPKLAGLFKYAPFFSGIWLILSLANIGFPGLSGFAGEFSIFLGSFSYFPVATSFGALVVIMSAMYQFKILKSMLFGDSLSQAAPIRPVLNIFQGSFLLIIIAVVLFLGIYPHFLFNLFESVI